MSPSAVESVDILTYFWVLLVHAKHLNYTAYFGRSALAPGPTGKT